MINVTEIRKILAIKITSLPLNSFHVWVNRSQLIKQPSVRMSEMNFCLIQMKFKHNKHIRSIDEIQLWSSNQPFLSKPHFHKQQDDSWLLCNVVELSFDLWIMLLVCVFIRSNRFIDVLVMYVVIVTLEMFTHMFTNVTVCCRSLWNVMKWKMVYKNAEIHAEIYFKSIIFFFIQKRNNNVAA